jgi:hypothetical protein
MSSRDKIVFENFICEGKTTQRQAFPAKEKPLKTKEKDSITSA